MTHPDDQNPFPNDIDAAEMEKAIEKVKLRFVEDNVDEIVDLVQNAPNADAVFARINTMRRDLENLALTYIEDMRSGVDRTDDE